MWRCLASRTLNLGKRSWRWCNPSDWGDANDDTEAELIDWMRERLSSVKVPRKVDFLEQLPRMDNGKLYKRHLQDAYREAV